MRTVSYWEQQGADIHPYPETQAYVKKTMQYARDIGA